jgi:hypothetical protein
MEPETEFVVGSTMSGENVGPCPFALGRHSWPLRPTVVRAADKPYAAARRSSAGRRVMASIFISHSSRDGEAAEEFRALLRELGHESVFLDFDPEDGIPPGRDWERELYRQLASCRAVVFLCSPHSVASTWCFAELTQAKALGKPLFPVKVAPCELPAILSGYQALDLAGDRAEAVERLRWRVGPPSA